MLGLERLFGGSPEQQGTLAAIAQIAQASGPQRLPQSLYSILGGGLMAGQQATQQAREQQQINQLRDFAIRDKKSDYEAQEAQRARAKGLLELNTAFQKLRGKQQSAPPVDRSANAAFQGLLGGGVPDVTPPGTPVQAPPASSSEFDRSAFAQQRLAYAQYLRDNGYGAEAQAEEDAALKMLPEFDTTPRTANGPDGKPFQYILGKRGEFQRLDGVLPREKLQLENLGGRSVAVNPFELRAGEEFQRTVTPDAQLSANTTMRGQNMTDARMRDANDIKLSEKREATNQVKGGQIASFDTMLGTLDRLSTHPGLSRSVGLYSKTPTIPGSDSANFQAELETFKSQAFIPMVAQLKGAGALSDAEGKKLTAAVGALDPRMGESAFRASIKRITDDMSAARGRLSGGAQPQQQGGRTVTRTGTYGGRKVVQYSDGSTEYAD